MSKINDDALLRAVQKTTKYFDGFDTSIESMNSDVEVLEDTLNAANYFQEHQFAIPGSELISDAPSNMLYFLTWTKFKEKFRVGIRIQKFDWEAYLNEFDLWLEAEGQYATLPDGSEPPQPREEDFLGYEEVTEAKAFAGSKLEVRRAFFPFMAKFVESMHSETKSKKKKMGRAELREALKVGVI